MLFILGLRQGFNERTNLVPHTSVVAQGLFGIAFPGSEFRRIVETHVNDLRVAGEYGAGLMGVAADGHDVVERNAAEVGQCLARVVGDVHPGLGHDFDRMGVQPVGFDASRVRLDDIALEAARPPLGHLASAGIAGTQEQDLDLHLAL